MSDLTSKYTIDLQIKDDKSKDAIHALDKSLKEISKTLKSNATGDKLTKNLEESQEAVQAMINKFHEMARNQDLDFQSISKAYTKNAGKALSELETQYIKQKDRLDEVQQQYDRLQKRIEAHKKGISDTTLTEEAQLAINKRIQKLEQEQEALGLKRLQSQIQQNREMRASLKAAEQTARMERANSKYEKLKELQAKRKAATDKAEKKDLAEKIKQQKAYIKAIEQAEKITQKTTEQTSKLGKAWETALRHMNRLGKVTQYAYNVTGMVGGAGKAVAKAGFGIAQGIGSAISAVSSGADQEVERERQANRVKGMSNDDAKSLLRELNVYTGADYSTIVEAINRVQGTLGRGLQRGELTQAVEMELRYPGISTAFASATGTGEAGAVGFRHYASKLNAIQKATGASAEQIAASTQAFANRKDIRKSSAAVSDYQAVYLAMQNSGAFESEEELNSVFDKFVQKHISSGKDVFEFAETFKMADYVHDTRNKIQAKTADSNMNWRQFAKDVRGSDGNEYGPSDAEKMAIKMREIEDKKNQLLMKLVPAVLPVVEKIADLITSPAGDQIIDGFVNLFKTVIPMLEPIFRALGVFLEFMSQTILPMFQWLVEKVSEFLGEQIDKAVDLLPQNANGGIAIGPSIVGERAFQPEMILPLDYSRSSRAGNIIQNVSQTFNMGGSETTALSLSQAVKSRDFRRATAQNAFISARGGLL